MQPTLAPRLLGGDARCLPFSQSGAPPTSPSTEHVAARLVAGGVGAPEKRVFQAKKSSCTLVNMQASALSDRVRGLPAPPLVAHRDVEHAQALDQQCLRTRVTPLTLRAWTRRLSKPGGASGFRMTTTPPTTTPSRRLRDSSKVALRSSNATKHQLLLGERTAWSISAARSVAITSHG